MLRRWSRGGVRTDSHLAVCGGMVWKEGAWCLGAESNHRLDDFQSSALPLSYPGVATTADLPRGGWSGERMSGRLWRSLERLASPIARSILFAGNLFGIGGAAGYRIAVVEPAVEVFVAAARGAERLEVVRLHG